MKKKCLQLKSVSKIKSHFLGSTKFAIIITTREDKQHKQTLFTFRTQFFELNKNP